MEQNEIEEDTLSAFGDDEQNLAILDIVGTVAPFAPFFVEKNGRHSEAQQKPFTEEGTFTERTDGRTDGQLTRKRVKCINAT
ncbi:hypothetical protein niasHT_039534 [Heterodera trifolii]|uniref:Uncharacterized protein n=1 Tax=Heterodera trifolii TaxID=157864 RepID=A0ABD2I9T8_9BILA